MAESTEELDEADKPDFLDIDKDGDKEESMKDAAANKKDKDLKEAIAGILRKHKKNKDIKEAIAGILRNRLKG